MISCGCCSKQRTISTRWRSPTESRPTTKVHIWQVPSNTLNLEIILKDENDEPRQNTPCSLTIEGDVHVEGTVEGEVRATGDIDIESTATVNARLEGRNISVRGQVRGDVIAQARLSVGGSGSVIGDISASRLRVDDGGTLSGTVSMGSAAERPAVAAAEPAPAATLEAGPESEPEPEEATPASVYSVPEEPSPEPPSFGPLPA